MIQINRRIIKDINSEIFAVYGIEKLDKFGMWREIVNFTDKGSYEKYLQMFEKTEDLEKIGNWESHPEL